MFYHNLDHFFIVLEPSIAAQQLENEIPPYTPMTPVEDKLSQLNLSGNQGNDHRLRF